MILESDGHSTSAPFHELATRMAQSKITVSTVALGAGADDVLLGKIAGWGRGRSYLVADVASVPQVFSKEAEEATGNTLREQSFKPVVKKNVQLFKGIDFTSAPDLLGYVADFAFFGSELIHVVAPVFLGGQQTERRPPRRKSRPAKRPAPIAARAKRANISIA